MFVQLMQEQQDNPADGNEGAEDEALAGTLPEECPGEQTARNQQERKDGRDDSGRDMALGHVDRVEVDAELREPEHDNGEHSTPVQPEVLAFGDGDDEHRSRGDNEAVGHRPLRRNDAELAATAM